MIRAIYCIGRNYGAHARELGNAVPATPVVFLKSPSALRSPADAGVIAFPGETFHHEVELVLHIGPESRSHAPASLIDRVDAVGLGLDLTRREVQNRLKKEGLPWTEAKSFKGAAVLSRLVPVPTGLDARQRSALLTNSEFTLWVGAEMRQHGTPRDMIFNIEALLEFIHASHGLHQGDIIFTGTPEGVGPLRAGDPFRMQLTWNGGSIVLDETGVL